MKRLLLIIFSFLIISTSMVLGSELLTTKQFMIENYPSKAQEELKIDPFYWSYMFFEEMALDLELHKKLSSQELLDISVAAYNSLSQTKPVLITIFDKETPENNLNITIGYRHNSKKYILILYANINPHTKKILKPSQTKFFWGKGFIHSHGRLINAEYVSNEIKIPRRASRTTKARYFLYDQTTLNNDEIPSMLRKDIKRSKKEVPFLSYIIQAQFYLSTKKLKEADENLRMLRIDECDNQAVVNLFHVTQLEVAFMRRIYKERKEKAKEANDKWWN